MRLTPERNDYLYRKLINSYLPTKFSRTLLLPALWLPTTAICGKSRDSGIPRLANTSCSLFTTGINCSIPTFPAMVAIVFSPHYLKLSYIWQRGSDVTNLITSIMSQWKLRAMLADDVSVCFCFEIQTNAHAIILTYLIKMRMPESSSNYVFIVDSK